MIAGENFQESSFFLLCSIELAPRVIETDPNLLLLDTLSPAEDYFRVVKRALSLL